MYKRQDWSGTSTAFNIGITTAVTPSFTLANTGTPAAGNIAAGINNVALFGFALTANSCTGSYDFTAASIATSGTATTSDLSNFRLIDVYKRQIWSLIKNSKEYPKVTMFNGSMPV